MRSRRSMSSNFLLTFTIRLKILGSAPQNEKWLFPSISSIFVFWALVYVKIMEESSIFHILCRYSILSTVCLLLFRVCGDKNIGTVFMLPWRNVGQIIIIEASWSHSGTLCSVGQICTSDKPDPETSNLKQTTFTKYRHPCTRQDSNPQSQQAGGRRSMP
jgi:hypothetical protein